LHESNLHSDHLKGFLDGTPLALERIRAAWPGLALADRIYLLSVLLAHRTAHPYAVLLRRHHEALIDIAMDDENAYVRYLAAKAVPPLDQHDNPAAQARLEKIGKDTSQLVRAAQQEVGSVPPPFRVYGEDWIKNASEPKYDPALFWTLDPTYRLAAASWSGEWEFSVAEPLRYATKELLPKGTVSVDEMGDVLLQYLGPNYIERFAKKRPRLRRSFYHFEKEVEELWNLVPGIPKQLAGMLLECLPGGSARSPMPPGILESLDDEDLAYFLWRDDVELKDLRRKLYVESSNAKLRTAAVRSLMFHLLDSDISLLVLDGKGQGISKSKGVEELSFLAKYCRSASLAQMEAVYQFLRLWSDYYRNEERDVLQSERAKRLWNDGKGLSALRAELLQLRVFKFAESLSPSNADDEPSALPESLKEYHHLITRDSPWQTYLNLWPAVGPLKWEQKLHDLPDAYIRDFTMPSDGDLWSEVKKR
jgi:hypothetical protein